MKHDENYHKFLRDEVDSIKRGQCDARKHRQLILDKLDNLPCQDINNESNPIRRIDKNTDAIKNMRKAGLFIAGLLGLKGFFIK